MKIINDTTSIAVSGKAQAIALRTLKGGAVTFISQKQMGAELGIKGSALKRAHAEYRFQMGINGNKNLSAKLAGGELMVQKYRPTKTGCQVTFVTPENIGVIKQDPKQAAQSLSNDELLAMLVARGVVPAK